MRRRADDDGDDDKFDNGMAWFGNDIASEQLLIFARRTRVEKFKVHIKLVRVKTAITGSICGIKM